MQLFLHNDIFFGIIFEFAVLIRPIGLLEIISGITHNNAATITTTTTIRELMKKINGKLTVAEVPLKNYILWQLKITE